MEETDIRYLVIIGISVMLLLIAGFLLIVVVNQRKKWQLQRAMADLREQQQNQLIEAAIKSEETERHRIAETLHDEVGAMLSSVRLHFSNIKTDHLDEKDRPLHEKSKVLLDDTIKKVRSISHNLHSTLLKEFGLNEAIRHFIQKTVDGSLVKAETHLDNQYNLLHPHTDISIYRMIQELLNNMLKHARATHIAIASTFREQVLTLTIRYNGSGLSQQEFEDLRFQPNGLGLKNIQNRIILLKGNIYFEKRPEENLITLTIPIKPES